jgi:hypothetical protein
VSFMLTGRKSYGRADSLEAAKASCKTEYERWRREADTSLVSVHRRALGSVSYQFDLPTSEWCLLGVCPLAQPG